MRVIILGAAGAMAHVCMRDLLEFGGESITITAADARPVSASDPRVSSIQIDARNIPATAKAVEGHDVVINCVTYYLNCEVMKAAVQARVPYIDLGGLYHGTMKQFALHNDFLRAGVPAVLGMGSTPGITNVMAGAIANEMDEVHEIHVRVGSFDESTYGALPVPYALDTILDEFSLEPMVFTNGHAVAVAPMSGKEPIDFPPPVGRMEALFTLHSEVAMFPRSFPELKESSFKVAFPADFTQKIAFLVELGFASREKRIRDVSPREMLIALAASQKTEESEPRDCDVLRVHVKGLQNGKTVLRTAESVILPHPTWKIAAGSLDTGVPLSIVAQMLARKEIVEPGVLCPEKCVPTQPFFGELARRGITAKFF